MVRLNENQSIGFDHLEWLPTHCLLLDQHHYSGGDCERTQNGGIKERMWQLYKMLAQKITLKFKQVNKFTSIAFRKPHAKPTSRDCDYVTDNHKRGWRIIQTWKSQYCARAEQSLFNHCRAAHHRAKLLNSATENSRRHRSWEKLNL